MTARNFGIRRENCCAAMTVSIVIKKQRPIKRIMFSMRISCGNNVQSIALVVDKLLKTAARKDMGRVTGSK